MSVLHDLYRACFTLTEGRTCSVSNVSKLFSLLWFSVRKATAINGRFSLKGNDGLIFYDVHKHPVITVMLTLQFHRRLPGLAAWTTTALFLYIILPSLILTLLSPSE